MEISTTTANENPRTRLEIVSPNFSKSINFKFPDAPAQPIQLVAFEEGKGLNISSRRASNLLRSKAFTSLKKLKNSLKPMRILNWV